MQIMFAAAGTLFTFLMTALGAALVFCFRGRVDVRAQRMCFGFAAGVMAAAAVFSLLLPAVEQVNMQGGAAWLTATLGFLLGAGAMIGADVWIGRRMREADEAQRARTLMVAAVTLHNIPEGMAVGLAFSLAAQSGGAALAAACALALGVGVQNFPEGAAISLPLRRSGMSQVKSFWIGVGSGAVEPVFGVLAVLFAGLAAPLMPGLMAFSAGAMMLVVVAEMIPEAAKERFGVYAVMAGYALMMALDVGLG